MHPRLLNKVAIVSGGGTGIGEAICKKFALEGAKVVVAGFPDDPVDDVANEIRSEGYEAISFRGDLSAEANVRACMKAAIDMFGKIDILVNNAGVFPAMEETQDFPVGAFDSLIKNNMVTTFLMTRAALPWLQQTKGNIISAGSEAGILGISNITPYGGTKAFVHAFMKGVAVEQAKYGVRANCVCPGPIDTSWTHKEKGPMSAKFENMMVDAVPLGRRGTPEEVANVYCFLASDEASYVTGALYTVDGGITVGKGPVGKEVPSEVKKQPEGELHLEHAQDGRAGQVL